MDRKSEEYRERVKDDMDARRERAEKRAEVYAERGKIIADKVSTDIDRSLDDLKISLRGMQKNLDDRIQDYKETPTEKIDLDLLETETKYYIKIDLAGVEKENISIQSSEKKITIEAEFPNTLDEIEEGKYIINGLKKGKIKRTINLPEAIEFKEVSAKFKLGTVLLDIPKVEVEKYEVDLE